MRYAPETILNVAGCAGSGKTALIGAIFGEEVTVFRPSDEIRKYAAEHSIPLATRVDYAAVHDIMHEHSPDYMVGKIMRLRGKVVLDGLRVYPHAQHLKTVAPDYHTVGLVCPDEVRFSRVINDSRRKNRPETIPSSLQEFLEEEEHEIRNYGLLKVLDMHDVSPEKFNTDRPFKELAFDLTLALRRYGWQLPL